MRKIRRQTGKHINICIFNVRPEPKNNRESCVKCQRQIESGRPQAKVSGDCVLLDWIMWMERGGFIISYQNPIKITRAHRK